MASALRSDHKDGFAMAGLTIAMLQAIDDGGHCNTSSGPASVTSGLRGDVSRPSGVQVRGQCQCQTQFHLGKLKRNLSASLIGLVML